MEGFDGKVVIITGGSSGIGRAIALAFGREGARVVVAARRDSAGEETANGIRDAGGDAIFVRADVMQEDAVRELVERALDTYGRLDIAFNNAGQGSDPQPLVEQTEESWRAEIDGNVTSVFFSMKHEIPAMLRNGGGTIVNTASVLGLVGIGGGIAPYVAAKHAVVGLTRAAALEQARSGVRINAIAPAVVDTPLFRSGLGSTEESAEAAKALHPVQRFGSPEEVASLVVYLASDGAWSAQ